MEVKERATKLNESPLNAFSEEFTALCKKHNITDYVVFATQNGELSQRDEGISMEGKSVVMQECRVPFAAIFVRHLQSTLQKVKIFETVMGFVAGDNPMDNFAVANKTN